MPNYKQTQQKANRRQKTHKEYTHILLFVEDYPFDSSSPLNANSIRNKFKQRDNQATKDQNPSFKMVRKEQESSSV